MCADILLDKRWPDLIRRRAMLARLTALQVEGQDDDDSPHLVAPRVLLTQKLRPIAALRRALAFSRSSLRGRERRVKIAVLQALQTLFFKRSFLTVRAGLRDPDPAVAEQACHAMEAPSGASPMRSIHWRASCENRADPTHRAIGAPGRAGENRHARSRGALDGGSRARWSCREDARAAAAAPRTGARRQVRRTRARGVSSSPARRQRT